MSGPEFDHGDDGALWDPIPTAAPIAPESCGACADRASGDTGLCRAHLDRLPRPLREELGRTIRAWTEGRASLDDVDDVRKRATAAAGQQALF